jgi:hypothetical protein
MMMLQRKRERSAVTTTLTALRELRTGDVIVAAGGDRWMIESITPGWDLTRRPASPQYRVVFHEPDPRSAVETYGFYHLDDQLLKEAV